MLKKISALSFCAISAFAMHTGEININDKDLELNAKFDMGQFNDAVEPATMFLGGRFLKADEDHAEHKADIDPYYEVNFLMMRPVGNQGMSIGLGAKANYTKDFSSIPLGVEFAYAIPAPKLLPMYLNASLYYAPEVLSFNDANNFLEYRISYDLEVIKNGRISVGYRNLDTNYENNKGGDLNYNSSWYIGFKIAF